MLIRICLYLGGRGRSKRVRGLISDAQVLATDLKKTSNLLKSLEKNVCDLLLIHREMISGSIVEFTGGIRKLPEQPEVVVISGHEDPVERAEYLASGAIAVIYDGLSDAAMKAVLGTIIMRRQEEMIRKMRSGRPDFQYSISDFVSASPAMRALLSAVHRIVRVDTSLLIVGETGVGKERLAKALHNDGPRSKGPFIHINCGALPESLLESELFGHHEGAFTGAIRSRRGFFELAHHGTIFLDEIGELPIHLQVKLLQVLQDHIIYPVGSEKPVQVDVRVIAATNRNLESEMKAKQFREDLYYRLSVLSLRIPPLRERREDIPMLLESYLQNFNRRFGRRIQMSGDASDALIQYNWPGNVRELINIIERSVLLCQGTEISLEDLPETITGRGITSEISSRISASAQDIYPESWFTMPWKTARREMMKELEHEYLRRLLEKNRGRIADTSQDAGISPRSLNQKMKYHGLKKESFKN